MFEPGCSGFEEGPRSLNNHFEPGCSGLEDGPRSLAECRSHIFFSIFQRHPEKEKFELNLSEGEDSKVEGKKQNLDSSLLLKPKSNQKASAHLRWLFARAPAHG